MSLPAQIRDVAHLDELLSEPTPRVVETLGRLDGDLLILGAAGKMGPTLARMARRASDAAGVQRRVVAVSRFTNAAAEDEFRAHGVETIKCDLLADGALAALPDAPNVVYMAGMKFGSTGNEALTWAMNVYLPGLVASRYRTSRIVAFSTGNIYHLHPLSGGGAVESDPLNPFGDYAQSCLGRERMFDHFSRAHGTPTCLIRLNYATELRYGVLVDIARTVAAEQPFDVTMAAANCLWQADANAMSLAAFDLCAAPAVPLNVAGPELLSLRRVAQQFGELLGKEPFLTGTEASSALITNGQWGHRLFGYPRVGAQQMIHWIADWVQRGGASLGKPTHFEVRDGKF
ncbi:MAG: NAD-dependent epimerase/dehydratase family protein [Fimbriimonadaceae bacterium]|nr:NAD-dependent epimerase/dehydratase family protein [Fimbriimonadaceae bacterium]